MKRQNKQKKFSFFHNLINWTFTMALAIILGFQVLDASASNLKFAQVSDAHYSSIEANTSYKILKESPAVLDDVISQINSSSKTDFVLFTGDLVNQARKSQLLEFIDKANTLKCPWYPLLGNHDVQEYVLTKDVFFDIMCEHNPNFNYTAPYYSFSPKKGFKVICLDTIILDEMTANGRVSEEQLKWLDSELKEAKDDVVIIGMHVPIIEPYPSEGHRLLNRMEVKTLLNKYKNPIIVCSGHYHGSKIKQENNILYIDSPSLVTFPCAFRYINICTQRHKVIIDVCTKQTRLEKVLNTAKIKVMGASFLFGTPEDRDNTFIIKR